MRKHHHTPVNLKQSACGAQVEDGANEDGFAELNRLRTVVVQKLDGQLGINPEVHCPDGSNAVIKIAKVYAGTRASASGVVSVGDTIKAINGQSLACAIDDSPLEVRAQGFFVVDAISRFPLAAFPTPTYLCVRLPLPPTMRSHCPGAGCHEGLGRGP